MLVSISQLTVKFGNYRPTCPANWPYRANKTAHHLPWRKAEDNEAHLATCFRATWWSIGLTRFRNLGFCSQLWNEMCSKKHVIALVPPERELSPGVRNLSLPCIHFHACLPTQQAQVSLQEWQNCLAQVFLNSCQVSSMLRILIPTVKYW